MKHRNKLSRRTFLKATAAAAAFPAIIPSSALGLAGATAPSNRVAMGFIGVGAKAIHGMGTFLGFPDAEVIAVCDVDRNACEQACQMANLEPDRAYNDFREMLHRADIDAVQVGSPDHWHVLHSLAAVRAGKDVYCEKPLSNTIEEGRALVDAVHRYGRVFQHGTQLRSLPGTRQACELVRNGRIGKLKRVLIGSPPGETTGHHPPEPIPEGFDYDLWLGPAPEAPFTPWRVKVPGHLPGWYFISDYSKAGWVAGHAVHDIDIAHWGMGMEHSGPISVEGEGVFPEDGLFDTVTTYRLEYRYPDDVTVIQTSTDQNPHGVRFEGEEGWVFTRGHIEVSDPELLREPIRSDEIRLYDSPNHERNFLDCVKSRAQTITPIEVAHRSTSTCLVGGIALKLNRPLRWDTASERFDDETANRLLSYPMRPPWHL